MDPHDAYPLAGGASPLADAGLPGEAVLRPPRPVHAGEVAAHPALPFRLLLVVPLAVIGARGLYAGNHVVKEIQIPVYVLGGMLHEAEAHVRGQVGGGVAYAPDALPGMHLLNDPARVLLQEPLRPQEAVAEDMEVRRELPEVLLLAPGVEHSDAGLASELEDRVVDVPLEDVEVLVGLHHALG